MRRVRNGEMPAVHPVRPKRQFLIQDVPADNAAMMLTAQTCPLHVLSEKSNHHGIVANPDEKTPVLMPHVESMCSPSPRLRSITLPHAIAAAFAFAVIACVPTSPTSGKHNHTCQSSEPSTDRRQHRHQPVAVWREHQTEQSYLPQHSTLRIIAVDYFLPCCVVLRHDVQSAIGYAVRVVVGDFHLYAIGNFWLLMASNVA